MIDEKKLIEEIESYRGDIFTDEIIDLIKQQPKVGEWIPADNPPDDDNYILLSFENFSLPMVGRYEESEDGGAYYLGDCDEEDACIANDLFVNAWQPLPKPFQTESNFESYSQKEAD